jgi:hypothetical protein
MKKEYWYDISNRSLETIAVWQTFASAFVVGEVSLTAHTASVALLNDHIRECNTAQDEVDLERSARNGVVAGLRGICARAIKLISGSLPPGDSMLKELRGVTSVRGQSQQAVFSKCTRLVSVWTMVNTHRAGMSPSLPPLTVGTVDVAEFQTMLAAHGVCLQNVENKLAASSRKKSQLRATARKVDKNNKRWYAAWQGQFAAGSPELDALSQVSTGTSTSAPGQGVFLGVEALVNQVVRLEFDAARATEFTLWHKGPGDADFAVLAQGLTENAFQHTAQPAGGHSYKVIGSNSVGTGAESLPVVVTVAEELAA